MPRPSELAVSRRPAPSPLTRYAAVRPHTDGVMRSDPAARAASEVRDRCVKAALAAYEQAGASGLCAEGRFELAVDAMRSLDVDELVRSVPDTRTTRWIP